MSIAGTRLAFLSAFAVLACAPSASRAAPPVAWWKFEPEKAGLATDCAGGIGDELRGNARYGQDGALGACLKFDGFTTHVRREAGKAPKLSGAFSIEAWVALQHYPWNWTAIVDRSSKKEAGYYFGIDYQGALGMKLAVDGAWVECTNSARDYSSILHTDGWEPGSVHTMIRSDRKLQCSVHGIGDLESNARISSDAWTQVTIVYAGSAGPPGACRIYLDGRLDGEHRLGSRVPAVLGSLQIGGWNGGDRNYRGSLDEVRIYGRALSGSEVSALVAGNGPTDPIARWDFDETEGSTARDECGEHDGELVGGRFSAGKLGRALELDGTQEHVRVQSLGRFDDFTLAVWVRPTIPSTEIPLHAWTHVVGTYDPENGIALYRDGQLVGSKSVKGKMTEAEDTELWIGLGHEKLCPIQTERGPSTVGSWMLLDGCLDEVKIHGSALSAEEVGRAFASVRPARPRPLSYWQMPTGPLGTGEFGARRVQLEYGDSWDDVVRAAEGTDVVVAFDGLPVRYVFWKGWNYGPCLVSENGLLMADQSVERGNENGCVEHMSDKQNRYASIQVIEDHEARVVLHWRYAPCDIFYGLVQVDPKTGWGDWCDEYFTIYPDGVMVRDQKVWSTGYVEPRQVGGYGGDPSVEETIFFSQPGKGPLDTVEVEALTLANDAGQTKTYAWQPDFPWSLNRDQPRTPTIQMVNFKSRYRPFLIRRPGSTVAAFPPSGFIDRNFPYWNHWPVSLLPNDGRKGTRTDRPAHTSLTWFCEPAESRGILHSWVYLYGMTTKPASALGSLSKSWNSPAPLKVESGDGESRGYDPYQRAYRIARQDPGSVTTLALRLEGSEASPVLNPAFVIAGWDETIPEVSVDGVRVPRGRRCRLGIQHELEGNVLVLWLEMEAVAPVRVTIEGPR